MTTARRLLRAQKLAAIMPDSNGTEALVNRVVGPTTDTGTLRIKTRTTGLGTGGRVRIIVASDSAMTQVVYYSPPIPADEFGDAFHAIVGLTRGELYYYRIQMNSTIDTHSVIGKIYVAPTVPTSFSFCFASCGASTDPVACPAIRARNDPLFIHMGDLWYADDTGQDITNYRYRINRAISAVNQGAVFATSALAYTPSDHDAAMKNNSVGTLDPAALATFNQVYRENFPAPLAEPVSGVYHTFAYGRIRFIVLDCRTFKSSPALTDNSSKTVLGTTQKQWVKDTITSAAEPVLVIVSDVPWAGPTTAGQDLWGGFNTERVELGDFINASGKKAVILGGDMHAVAHSSGAAYGMNIPNYQAAPLQGPSSIKGAPWDAIYPATAGIAVSQYGRVVVTDNGGSTISLAFTGYSSDNTVRVSRTDVFSV